MREVQTITTSATVYGEVQTISTSASIGSTITGNIAMRIPEVQTITVSASSALSDAHIKATFTHYIMPSPGASKSTSFTTTSCIDLVAFTADELAGELESLSNIDSVQVTKSGHGGYSDDFGFVFSVTFVGDKVAGNVELLDIDVYTDSGCSTPASDFTVSVATVNENMALGLDTEVHTITINASEPIAQGQFKIAFAEFDKSDTGSGCVEWNATATELQTAIETVGVELEK